MADGTVDEFEETPGVLFVDTDRLVAAGLFDDFVDAGQRYWTTARRSAKAKRQLRHWKTKRWIKSRLNFDFPDGDTAPRARTSPPAGQVDHDLDAVDIPGDGEGFGPEYEINPGLVKRKDPYKAVRTVVRGVDEYGEPVEVEEVRNVLDVNKKPYNRTKVIPSPRPPSNADGPRLWINNGADWDSWDDATKEKVLRKFMEFQAWDPDSASSIEDMVANVVDAFDAASPLEVKFGERWYEVAAERAGDLALEFGVPPQFAAAVIAATSPRTAWEHNLAAARLAMQSLLPQRSPDITNDFLNVRMKYDEDLNGDKLKKNDDGEYIDWPTGWDYILNDKNVRSEFKRMNAKDGNETKQQYEQRITDLITATLNQQNPDGSPLKLHQFRNKALRGALMDINNRHLGRQANPDARPGMGLLVPTYTSDGFLRTDKLRAFPGILEGNNAALDRLFGYDELHPQTMTLDKGWDGTAGITDIESLLQRIETSLAGHKVRSFYNNIVTRGQSDFATIDVHALRAALSGKAATRAGLAVPGQEDLLDDTNDKDPDQARIGAYGAVNEAFRRAAATINARRAEQGLPPLSVAQVQAVAWIASRPESIAGQMTDLAMDVRDIPATLAELLPDVPSHQRTAAWREIAKMRNYNPAQLVAAGIDPDTVDQDTFVEAKKIIKQSRDPVTKKLVPSFVSVLDQYKAGTSRNTIGRTMGQMRTIAWLIDQAGTGPEADQRVVDKVRNLFATQKRNPQTGEPQTLLAQFTLDDLRLMKGILDSRHMFPATLTVEQLLAGPAGNRVLVALQRINDERARSGVTQEITVQDFIQYMQEGDYV